MVRRLNAPYGARCFMTREIQTGARWSILVLMHRLALGTL